MVVRERLGHVLVDLTVVEVKQVVLWTQQETSEPCSQVER